MSNLSQFFGTQSQEFLFEELFTTSSDYEVKCDGEFVFALVGGGGSGAATLGNDKPTGGAAGEFVLGKLSLSRGDVVRVEIGRGGSGVDATRVTGSIARGEGVKGGSTRVLINNVLMLEAEGGEGGKLDGTLAVGGGVNSTYPFSYQGGGSGSVEGTNKHIASGGGAVNLGVYKNGTPPSSGSITGDLGGVRLSGGSSPTSVSQGVSVVGGTTTETAIKTRGGSGRATEIALGVFTYKPTSLIESLLLGCSPGGSAASYTYTTSGSLVSVSSGDGGAFCGSGAAAGHGNSSMLVARVKSGRGGVGAGSGAAVSQNRSDSFAISGEGGDGIVIMRASL